MNKRDHGRRNPATDGGLPQYPIESVDNALRVLLLYSSTQALRLTDVSTYLGVASSTAHRLLAALQYRGFVWQDPDTRLYRPGPSLTGVAFSILQRFDFRSTLRPFLERLHSKTGETVHLGVLDGARIQFVDAIESPMAVRVASRVGRSMPATCTSAGKALLAELSVRQLRLVIPDESLQTMTERSLRTRSELEAALAVVRRQGHALSREEGEPGVRSVAVALPELSGPARIAFSVAAPSGRMSSAEQHAAAATLKLVVAEARHVHIR